MKRRPLHLHHLGRYTLLLCSILLGMLSCQHDRQHLSEKEMANVIYDLHVAQAMAYNSHSDSTAYYEALYRDAILQKYGLTAAELDFNISYYSTHADALFRIYSLLEERTYGQDYSANTALNFSESGDTINMWQGINHLLLIGNGRNSAHFTIAADTLVQPGDMLEWHLTASSIYSEGERNANVSIRLAYTDSTALMTRQIGGYGAQTINIPLSSTRQLRTIDLTLLQNATWKERTQLLNYSNIYLLRIRPKQAQHDEQTDSLSAPNDSLRRDTIPAGGRTLTRRNSPAHISY